MENNLSFLFLVSLPLAIICEAAGSRAKFFFVFCTALWLWTYELTLLLGFRLTGPFVIMIYKMLFHDVARFASIYVLILFGHAACWYVIEVPTGVQTPFDEFFDRLTATFMIMFGQISFDDGFAWAVLSNYEWLSSLLLIFHVVFVFIMLLNVLIGMMGDTFHEVKERSDQEWHLAYAQIISSCEAEIPKHHLQDVPYWTRVGGKRYLQVQDVDKDYFAEYIDPEATKNTLAEALTQLDLNQDGVISVEEIKAAEDKAEETGEVLTIQRIDSDQKDREKALDEQEREQMENLGVTDHLEGRLDSSVTSS